jgi:hypothetical protein
MYVFEFKFIWLQKFIKKQAKFNWLFDHLSCSFTFAFSYILISIKKLNCFENLSTQ